MSNGWIKLLHRRRFPITSDWYWFRRRAKCFSLNDPLLWIPVLVDIEQGIYYPWAKLGLEVGGHNISLTDVDQWGPKIKRFTK